MLFLYFILFLDVQWIVFYVYPYPHFSEWVMPKKAIFQLYHCTFLMTWRWCCLLCTRPTLATGLVDIFNEKQPMLHSDTLFWLWNNQCLIILLNTVWCLLENKFHRFWSLNIWVLTLVNIWNWKNYSWDLQELVFKIF